MAEIIIKINPDLCTERMKEVLQKAIDSAGMMRSEFLTPEHLMLCITYHEEFIAYCDEHGIDYETMRYELEDYLMAIEELPENTPDAVPEQSVGFVEVMDRLQDFSARTSMPVSIPVLVSYMTKGQDDYIPYIIQKYLGFEEEWHKALYDVYEQDIKDYLQKVMCGGEYSGSQDLLDYLKKSVSKLYESINAIGGNEGGSNGQQGRRAVKNEPWEEFVTCLNDTYKFHNPLIGRHEELQRTMQILCRKDKNNPLHIGEAGVGKTALIYGLAAKIESGDVPEQIAGYRIYMCDMGALLSGTSYQGELEKRIRMIMEGMSKTGRCILYIDEIHTIMGGNGNGGNTQNISNLLKPYLEDGSIRFIGSTTYQDYNRVMAKDKGIVRRFQQIDILEPSVEETIEIVKGVISDYENHHGVRYSDEAIRYAVEKSDALIADRFLPDKAIDIIDEAGAYLELHPLLNKKGEKMSAGRQKVGKEVINDILSKVCKINAKALTEDDNMLLKDLDQRICSDIYGQDDAVSRVVRAVKMAKAGLIPTDKPMASLLFVGPTGVGKTEVCKVLAKELGIELVRFDMSEYTEKHTVAKLIGSPAGYVGYDDGGLLTDAIRKSPNCVLLLDEIEKAHQDIYNILLQVMDYARLTDNKGNKVDFKNVILIMTSNAGAQYAAQAGIGFAGGQTRGEAMMQTVKKTFKPEFLNRLSGTVVFRDMDEKMAQLILDKKLRQLGDMLAHKGVTLTLTDDARQLLLDKGYTRQYGAREMDRVIQNLLTPLLMDEILFGCLINGGNVTVGRKENELAI